MFGTGRNIPKSEIDFDKLAQIYIKQRFNKDETPEEFFVRFIQVRESMLNRFKAEPQKPISAPPSVPPTKSYWTM